MDSSGEVVRSMWVAYREGDFEAALPLLSEDCRFVPADGKAFEGHAGIRRFFARFPERGESFMASPYSFERRGDGRWLVIGHRRIRSGSGIEGGTFYFVHLVRDGQIVHLSAHPTRSEAQEMLERI